MAGSTPLLLYPLWCVRLADDCFCTKGAEQGCFRRLFRKQVGTTMFDFCWLIYLLETVDARSLTVSKLLKKCAVLLEHDQKCQTLASLKSTETCGSDEQMRLLTFIYVCKYR